MYEYFMTNGEYIEDGIVYSQGIAVGILAPATLFGRDEAGRLHVCGRKAIVEIEERESGHFWRALVDSDAILFGDPAEIHRCISLLRTPLLSRSVSYLSTVATNCADLLAMVSAVRGANVLVLGCGGIGSLVAMNLAGAGVGSLVLIDPDVIELSNLNRQFFWTPCQVGEFKVAVLRDLILERYPNVAVEPRAERLTADQVVAIGPNHDAMVITADEPLGLVEAVATRFGGFIAYGGYFQGQIGYLACKQRRPLAVERRIVWARNPHFIGPSSGPGNTEVAGAVASACVHYLCRGSTIEHLDIGATWSSNRVWSTRSDTVPKRY